MQDTSAHCCSLQWGPLHSVSMRIVTKGSVITALCMLDVDACLPACLRTASRGGEEVSIRSVNTQKERLWARFVEMLPVFWFTTNTPAPPSLRRQMNAPCHDDEKKVRF